MTCSSSTTYRPDAIRARAGRGIAALAASLLLVLFGQPALADDAGELIVEAKGFLNKGDGIAAEAKLRDALQKGARRKSVAAYMGEALLAQGNAKKARDWLRRRDFSPASAAVGFRTLARLELSEGKMRAAGKAFDKAIKLTPADVDMWVEIGRFRYVAGEHLLAIDAANHALKLAPENVGALLFKGQLVRDSRGLVPALRYFEKAREKAPDDLLILGEYAATLGELGRAKQMLDVTRRMIEIDAQNPRAFYLQAVLAARAGKYALTKDILDRAEARLKGLPGAMLLRGIAEMEAGNYALAVEALDPLVKKQPGNMRARQLLARALYLADEHKYLIDRFGKAAGDDNASPYLKTLVARSHEVLGQRTPAANLLNEAARDRPAAVFALAGSNDIGEMLSEGRLGEAQGQVRRWLAENNGYYDNLALAGDVALASGDAKQAARYYRRAARIRQTDSLMERRFQALLLSGQMAKAVSLSETYLRNNPTSRVAIRSVGWMAAYSGDWARARILYEALAGSGSHRDVQLLADLSLVQLNAGDKQASLKSAEQAYRLQRANPIATQAWGLSLTAAGERKPAAKALLHKARAIMGDNPMLAEARLKLAGRT